MRKYSPVYTKREEDELLWWGRSALLGLGAGLTGAALVLVGVFALLGSANAQAWGSYGGGTGTSLSDRLYPDTGANIRNTDMGGGFGYRSGSVNGRPYSSTTIDMGGGFKTETGTIGNRSFNCTTIDMGGGFATTTCN